MTLHVEALETWWAGLYNGQADAHTSTELSVTPLFAQ
jgi:hypothetical protein